MQVFDRLFHKNQCAIPSILGDIAFLIQDTTLQEMELQKEIY